MKTSPLNNCVAAHVSNSEKANIYLKKANRLVLDDEEQLLDAYIHPPLVRNHLENFGDRANPRNPTFALRVQGIARLLWKDP